MGMSDDAHVMMAREPHPFVNGDRMLNFRGCAVAVVGKVERLESGSFIMKTTDDKEVKVTGYAPMSDDPSQQISAGNAVEVRGVVDHGDDALPLSLKYSDLNKF